MGGRAGDCRSLKRRRERVEGRMDVDGAGSEAQAREGVGQRERGGGEERREGRRKRRRRKRRERRGRGRRGS